MVVSASVVVCDDRVHAAVGSSGVRWWNEEAVGGGGGVARLRLGLGSVRLGASSVTHSLRERSWVVPYYLGALAPFGVFLVLGAQGWYRDPDVAASLVVHWSHT